MQTLVRRTIRGILFVLVLLVLLLLLLSSFAKERQIDLNTGDRRTVPTVFGITISKNEIIPFKGRDFMPGGERLWKPMAVKRGLSPRWVHGGYGSEASDIGQAFTAGVAWDLDDDDRLGINTILRDTFASSTHYSVAWSDWHETTIMSLADSFSTERIPLWIEPYEDVVFPPVKQLFRIKPDSYPGILDQKYIVGSGESYCWLLWNVTEDDLSPDEYSLVESDPDRQRIDTACLECGFDVDFDDSQNRYRAAFDEFELFAIPVRTREGDPAIVMRLLKIE